ncbi:radical SAM protein, partial [Candidatus Microgenomates bacterium]|nr:radical SAM protein [Candidatus Microgenomates bacterium]
TEAFGLDTGESLIDLIDRIINSAPVPRISFGSIHPWSLTDEFFDYYKKILPLGRLINFFHVPLQSGSDKILALMKRGYTSSELMEKLKRLRKINPMAFIGTDVIVGFPGETDEDFKETYQFLKESPISRFHIFRFSPREGTAAYFLRKKYQEPLPQVKTKRAKILAELSKQKYQKFLEKHLGKTFPALFLERRTGGYQEALLNNQIPVLIKTKKDLKRSINKVKIVSLHMSSLTGIASD